MGAYISVISGVLKLLNWATQALQQHHDEVNGRNAEKVETNAATTKVLQSVAAPIGDAASDKLWDDNKAKFGPGGTAGG